MRSPLKWLPVVAVLAASGCSKAPAGKEDAPPDVTMTVEAATVAQKTMHETVYLDGNFVFSPGDYARLSPATSGRLTSVLVKEGDHVQKGQLLAQIDMAVLGSQKSSAALGASSAAAQTSQAVASLQAAKSELSSQIKTAELTLESAILERNSNVDAAQTDLDKLKAGARPQEIAQAEQALRQARINRDHAKSDSDRDQMLLKEGYVSGQQAEASKAAYEVADSGLRQAQQQLELIKLGARQEDLKAAAIRLQAAKQLGDKKVEAARTALQQAKQGILAVRAKDAEVAAAKLTASQKSADAAAASGQVSFGEIRAPFSGTIVRRSLNPGDSADTTAPVLEETRDGSSIEFAGAASSSVASQLTLGMSAFGGEGIETIGTVRSIGVADVQSGLVPVRIHLTHPPEGASTGQFSRLRVVLKELKDALVVPVACVVTRDDKEYVYVVNGGKAALTEVTAGPTEAGNTAILKGLQKGQQVVVLGQHELSDGAKIEIAKPEAEEQKGTKSGEKPEVEPGKSGADK